MTATHSELRTVIPELRDSGFDILFLSNDRPELLCSSLQRETQEDIDGLDYVILSVADLNAAMALGTAFRTDKRLTDYLGQKGRDFQGSSIGKHNSLAVPGVYVIDLLDNIVFDFVNDDYKVRLSAEDLLAAADSIQGRCTSRRPSRSRYVARSRTARGWSATPAAARS